MKSGLVKSFPKGSLFTLGEIQHEFRRTAFPAVPKLQPGFGRVDLLTVDLNIERLRFRNFCHDVTPKKMSPIPGALVQNTNTLLVGLVTVNRNHVFSLHAAHLRHDGQEIDGSRFIGSRVCDLTFGHANIAE